MLIHAQDIYIRWFSGSGAGGQHRNKSQNCCEITHIPTGIKQQSTGFKSREQNKKAALLALSNILLNEKLKNYHLRLNELRKKAQENGRIRTYDFKRGQVDCHITGEKYKLRDILNGRLDELITNIKLNETSV